MGHLYILEINLLLVSSFANILSYLWVVILFMVSFAVQKLLSLIRSHLLIFVFITLGGGPKKILLQFMSKRVFLMFPYKSFIVSGFTFRSLIHFFWPHPWHAEVLRLGIEPVPQPRHWILNLLSYQETPFNHFEIYFCIWCLKVFLT